MTRTIKLYRIEIKYPDKSIVWDYGEPRGIEFIGSFLRVSGVGIMAEYPLKGMVEFHMTTKDEVININPRKITRIFDIKGGADK